MDVYIAEGISALVGALVGGLIAAQIARTTANREAALRRHAVIDGLTAELTAVLAQLRRLQLADGYVPDLNEQVDGLLLEFHILLSRTKRLATGSPGFVEELERMNSEYSAGIGDLEVALPLIHVLYEFDREVLMNWLDGEGREPAPRRSIQVRSIRLSWGIPKKPSTAAHA